MQALNALFLMRYRQRAGGAAQQLEQEFMKGLTTAFLKPL